MGHVTQSEAWHSIGAGGLIDPPHKSEPSTSEDEDADLGLLGFYEAAGMGAPDHRDVGWTVRCELSSMMSETATLDPKNLSFMDSDNARKRSNPWESTGCTSYHPSIRFSQTIQSH